MLGFIVTTSHITGSTNCRYPGTSSISFNPIGLGVELSLTYGTAKSTVFNITGSVSREGIVSMLPPETPADSPRSKSKYNVTVCDTAEEPANNVPPLKLAPAGSGMLPGDKLHTLMPRGIPYCDALDPRSNTVPCVPPTTLVTTCTGPGSTISTRYTPLALCVPLLTCTGTVTTPTDCQFKLFPCAYNEPPLSELNGCGNGDTGDHMFCIAFGPPNPAIPDTASFKSKFKSCPACRALKSTNTVFAKSTFTTCTFAYRGASTTPCFVSIPSTQ